MTTFITHPTIKEHRLSQSMINSLRLICVKGGDPLNYEKRIIGKALKRRGLAWSDIGKARFYEITEKGRVVLDLCIKLGLAEPLGKEGG